MNTQRLREQFETIFAHSATAAVRAPGRVNLIGEHTDYNGGLVLPIAIERQTVALFAPRDGREIRIASLQSQGQIVTVPLDQPIAPAEPKWANYCRGVVAYVLEHGVALGGLDILFDSDVPLGGGLSSSASLEVATAVALLSSAGQYGSMSPRDLALLCQKAENVFAGAPCGIMDQSIAVMGRAGKALLLDCRSGHSELIPFDNPHLVLLVADTQVKHDIGDGGYPLRRKQCHQAAATMGVGLLREADISTVERASKGGGLAGKELMRARHVVGEIQRTIDAVAALRGGDFTQFGQLMYASHESLRIDFEVSCDELDEIVKLARSQQGVYGARMTGGGFGGCAIVLAEADRSSHISAAIAEGFARRFGRPCPIFATRAADGAGLWPLS